MADILTLLFRTFSSQAELKETPSGSAVPGAGGGALLVGERSVSRSVLLLAAVTAASELGLRVVVFTQTQIQSLPAPLQRRVPSLGPESLKVGSMVRTGSGYEAAGSNPKPDRLQHVVMGYYRHRTDTTFKKADLPDSVRI